MHAKGRHGSRSDSARCGGEAWDAGFGFAIRVETDAACLPVAFTWRSHTYHVQVIGHWHLQNRWWDVEKQSNRLYYRVQAPDLQMFERYHDTTSAALWVLDKVLD
jgi:hypothetical protein